MPSPRRTSTGPETRTPFVPDHLASDAEILDACAAAGRDGLPVVVDGRLAGRLARGVLRGPRGGEGEASGSPAGDALRAIVAGGGDFLEIDARHRPWQTMRPDRAPPPRLALIVADVAAGKVDPPDRDWWTGVCAGLHGGLRGAADDPVKAGIAGSYLDDPAFLDLLIRAARDDDVLGAATMAMAGTDACLRFLAAVADDRETAVAGTHG